MKVGYAVLYADGTLVISKNHTILPQKIKIDYDKFEDTCVPWKRESEKIKKVRILDQVKTTCMHAWFGNCMNLLTLIDFENLDVSNCIDFSYMFYNCNSLQNLNELQNWNVSSGTNLSRMFYNCESLQNIDALKTWNVSNGTDFSFMFAYCKSLQDLNGLEKWNISNGTNFAYMFSCCTLLKEIYLSNTLDILKKEIFNNCNLTLKIHWGKHIYTYEDLLEYETIS